MTPLEAVRRVGNMQRRITDELRQAERKSVQDLRETAEGLSGGTVSLEELAKEGHPYARRHGKSQRPAEVINIQSGDFVTSWEETGPQADGDDLVSTIFNTAPEAEFLWSEGSQHADKGTDLRFGRPVHLAAAAEVEPRREQRLEEAIERGMQ